MEKASEYLGLGAALLLSAAIAALILVLNRALGPKKPVSETKAQPFECGIERLSRPTGQFSVKFYLVAMLFILFDVEVVWLFPWAVLLKELGWGGIVTMFSFLFVLVLGFIYAWKKGALEWEK